MTKKNDPVYSGDILTLRQQLIALAAHWRSEGEYWTGTPEDMRSQHCADELLKVVGATDDARVGLDQKAHSILKPFGITNHEPPDRGRQYSDDFKFNETKGWKFVRDIFKEMGTWGKARSEKQRKLLGVVRPLDILIHEKLWWSYSEGWLRGFQRGAQAGKKRYKRGK